MLCTVEGGWPPIATWAWREVPQHLSVPGRGTPDGWTSRRHMQRSVPGPGPTRRGETQGGATCLLRHLIPELVPMLLQAGVGRQCPEALEQKGGERPSLPVSRSNRQAQLQARGPGSHQWGGFARTPTPRPAERLPGRALRVQLPDGGQSQVGPHTPGLAVQPGTPFQAQVHAVHGPG